MKCLWHCCKKEVVAKKKTGPTGKFCGITCKNKYHTDRRRRQLKKLAVDYKGGKCKVCGYNKCVWAMDFHHRNRSEKAFSISRNGCTYSWEKVKDELDKCDLVCANCHREIESKLKGENRHNWDKSNDYKKYKDSQIERKRKNKCKCGKTINKKNKACVKCRSGKDKPTKEWLSQLIYMMPFTDIGKVYKVTDNSVRKWCVTYGIKIPKFPKGYWLTLLN